MTATHPASTPPSPSAPERAGGSSRSKIGRFVALPGKDRSLLLEAAVLLTGVRVAIVAFPFTALRRVLDRLARRFPRRGSLDPRRLSWALEVAGRNVPGTRHCLTQAVAGQVMLARSGIPAHLRIGLARGEQGELHGHAWLESGGVVVVGGAEASEYKQVESFRGDPT